MSDNTSVRAASDVQHLQMREDANDTGQSTIQRIVGQISDEQMAMVNNRTTG